MIDSKIDRAMRPAVVLLIIIFFLLQSFTIDRGRTWGIDVSHYNGKINWSRVDTSGAKFVYIRKSAGFNYDRNYLYNWKTTTLPKSMYHFFHPDKSGKKQAQVFLLNYQCEANMDLVLDVEYSKRWRKCNKKNAVKRMIDFISSVEKTTGQRVMIYTNTYFWHRYITPYSSKYFLDREAWVARYHEMEPFMPRGLMKMSLWQASSRGRVDGIRGWVDINYRLGEVKTINQIYEEDSKHAADTTLTKGQ